MVWYRVRVLASVRIRVKVSVVFKVRIGLGSQS
jgi:hypothetical protein